MDIERLKYLFSYNSNTGVFTRNVTITGSAKAGTTITSINKDGYLQVRVDGKMHLQHRLAWLYVMGEMPIGDIDHINHNRKDNRIQNIRVVDKATNNKNLSKRRNNTSGYTGVSWLKSYGKWCAEIMCDKEKIIIGYFDDVHEAGKARKRKEIDLGFHENHGE